MMATHSRALQRAQMRAQKRSTIAVISALLATAALAPAAHAGEATPAPAGTCPAVHLVTTAGTSESNPADDPHSIDGFANGRNFTKTIADRYRNVTAWQTPYEASSGIIHSVGETRSTTLLPYSASKRQAVEAVTAHLSEVKNRCPNTKFVLSGFSQGAEVTGDALDNVVAGRGPITTADIAGAYLIADPKRSALTSEPATTNTGFRGTATRSGAILIPIDRGRPATRSEGAGGHRADNLYRPLAGKIRQICFGPDAVCASHPNDPAARIARYESEHTEVNPDYYKAVTLRSMLTDGSAARALGPRAGATLSAIMHADYKNIARQFTAASRAPGLTERQRATMRLMALELPAVMEASGITINTVRVTGNTDLDRLISLLRTIGTTDQGLGKLWGMVDFVPSHTAYFSGGMNTATIGGKPVDLWVERDLDALVRQNGARR